MVCTVRERVVLWEAGTDCRIYPALFVIRTPTVNRKLNDCGARSVGCSRHALSGSRKQPCRPRCHNLLQKSSHTRQKRGILLPGAAANHPSEPPRRSLALDRKSVV